MNNWNSTVQWTSTKYAGHLAPKPANVNTALATWPVRSVVAEWQSNQDLCYAAAAGKMAKVGSKESLDRKEV